MNHNEAVYPCIGVCTTDPDSGYCLGCGRPPEGSGSSEAKAVVVVESVSSPSTKPPSAASLDTPD